MALQNLLSVNFLVPFTAMKIDFSRSIRGLRGMPRRVLLLGHKLNVGSPTIETLEAAPWAQIVPATVAPGTAPVNSVLFFGSEPDAVAALGEGSMLLAMWRGSKANKDIGLPVDVMAVPASETAVAAATELVVNLAGATVGESGEAFYYVEGVRIAVGVTSSDTEATIATKLIGATNAIAALPVVASGVADHADRVKLTCRWPGATGNQIDVRGHRYADDLLPAGLTLTIPAMSGGTTSPSLTAAIAAMEDGRWTEIVLPFTDSTSMEAIEAELEKRWAHNNMRDGQVVTSLRGAVAGDIKAWLATRNSAQVHTIPTKKDMTSPWVTAAMAGAGIETSAVIDPALPYTDIPLVGYVGPVRGDHWTIDEANELLLAGASPLAMATDGTATLQRVVTNYTKNVVDADDASRRELAWVKSMSYYRWYVTTEFMTKYRGFKMAEYIDQPIPGQKIMTDELGEEIMLGCYNELCKVALVQNMEHYAETLIVEEDGTNGRLKIQDEPVLVTQHYQNEITSYPIAGHV